MIFLFSENLVLDGSLKDTRSIFIIVLSLCKMGIVKNVLVPKDSFDSLSHIPNINLFCVDTLTEAIEFFTNSDHDKYKYPTRQLDTKYILVNNSKYFYSDKFLLDYSDVKGTKDSHKSFFDKCVWRS